MFGGVNRQRRILCGITSHGVERCYTEDNIGRGHNVPLPALWGNVARISAELGMRAPLTGRDATGGKTVRLWWRHFLPLPRSALEGEKRIVERFLYDNAHLVICTRRGRCLEIFLCWLLRQYAEALKRLWPLSSDIKAIADSIC